MSKDQEMETAEMDSGASDSGQPVDDLASDPNEQAHVIVEHWRNAWSDLSRTEEVIAQGPCFLLWHFDSDGFTSPGAFFAAEEIDRLIPPEELRAAMRECLGEIDHAFEMAVLLVLKGGAGAAMAVIPKTALCKPQAWFEMAKLRRTSLSEKVWIPLRAASTISNGRDFGYEGYLGEDLGVGSVMFDLQHRDQILQLGWSDIGGNDFAGGEVTHRVQPEESAAGPSKESEGAPPEHDKPVASFRLPFTSLTLAVNARSSKSLASESDKPLEAAAPAAPQFVSTYYWAGDWASHHSNAVGTALVIEQNFDGEAPREWHLHLDFVISLGLQRQGDTWLRPAEGFQEVARLTRDDRGRPVLLEVRNEHLRDYLKARGMYLLISSYRNHTQIVSDASHMDWAPGVVEEQKDGQKWEGVNLAIHEGGMPYGSSTGVFHVSRTDIDDDDDVPRMGLPDDDSVVSKSWSVQHQGRKLYRLSGSLWKNDVVEPGRVSERVKGEPPPTQVDFAINGSGERLTGDQLTHSGAWLWFRPNVTALLGSYRGSTLTWFTRDTGTIGISEGNSVHFGLNDLGLINVYAKDIGLLPAWQQRVWAGANVVPDGGVSAELLASQSRAAPADTKAPEMQLRPLYEEVNAAFEKVSGKPLFAPHHAIDDIFKRIHRFRALEKTGVLELAKDLARLTVESLDGDALTAMGAHPGKTKPGSMKHLDAGLMMGGLKLEEAMALSKVLVGINLLRQADAHLPSSEFAKAFDLVGVDQRADPVMQGRQMLELLVQSLAGMAKVVSQLPRKS